MFHNKFVNQTTLLAMLNSVPLNQGWSPGLSYGLGLMHWKLPKTADPLNQTITLGHGGADWGSIAMVRTGVRACASTRLSVRVCVCVCVLAGRHGRARTGDVSVYLRACVLVCLRAMCRCEQPYAVFLKASPGALLHEVLLVETRMSHTRACCGCKTA